jgi:hypothetical protein
VQKPVALLLAEETNLVREIELAVPGRLVTLIHTTAPRMPTGPGFTLAVLAAIEVSSDWWRVAHQFLRRHALWSRTIVIAPMTRDNATALARTEVSELVWLDAIHERLQGAVERLLDGSPIEMAIAQLLHHLGTTDPLVTAAIQRVLRASPPVRSVTDLCRVLYCSSTTLRAHWRGQGLPGSPRDLIDIARLLRIPSQKASGNTLSGIRRNLGIHRSTLHRLCIRWTGRPPSELENHEVLAALQRWAS